ncbi:MAG: protein kinase [Pirellulales bacterium]
MKSTERDPLDLVAEEFALRCRRGETPSLGDYVARYPELAADLKEVLPSVMLLERAKKQLSAGGSKARSLPERIGDFRIVREIGRGGMGVVYEAVQESLGRSVALKVLPREFSENPQRVERFRREARAAAQLHHTGIVPVFGVGDDGGTYYIVMQLIVGRSLERVIRELRDPQSQRDTAWNKDATPARDSMRRPKRRTKRARRIAIRLRGSFRWRRWC